MKAIVYTSNTGSTEQYAKMLAEKLQIPCYTLKTAYKQLSEQSEILYLGWIMAGKISGYRAATKRYRILGVCAVSVVQNADEDLRNYNRIPQKLPLFSLQGDFDLTKLHGVHRFVVKLVIRFMKNKAKKQQGAYSGLLQILINGKQGVDQKNLDSVLAFCDDKETDSVTV